MRVRVRVFTARCCAFSKLAAASVAVHPSGCSRSHSCLTCLLFFLLLLLPLPRHAGQGCLFNLATDLNESHNLRNDPDHADLFDKLTAMLAERGATGPPLTSAFPLGEMNRTGTVRSHAFESKFRYKVVV